MACQPVLIAMDLEGVLVPEVWIAVAERTGIPTLRLTTRDVPDYDELMRGRLRILREHGLKLADIQNVIAGMDPLPGALDFANRIRERFQLIILSDTYYEFATPLMRKLGWPTLFCNSMETNGKKHAVLGFRALNFDVVAVGDSYNDTAMLGEAHLGILFRPSAKVRQDFPQFPVVEDYAALERHISEHARR